MLRTMASVLTIAALVAVIFINKNPKSVNNNLNLNKETTNNTNRNKNDIKTSIQLTDKDKISLQDNMKLKDALSSK